MDKTNQYPQKPEEHLLLLRKRGMSFDSEDVASYWLSRVSYFRLKYYWTDWFIGDNGHHFSPQANFSKVLARYDFDRRLRLILFEAIEMIEVAFRTRLVNLLSNETDTGLWYLDSSLFERVDRHAELVIGLKKEFSRSTEPFAKLFCSEHPDYLVSTKSASNPDAWMLFEVATFGKLSKLYKNLKHQHPCKAMLAKDFGLFSSREFSGWLEAISVLRNIIAHHSRLWNRSLAKPVVNPKSPFNPWLNRSLTDEEKKRPFGVISALMYLCNTISPNNDIHRKLLDLFSGSGYAFLSFVGFPTDWHEQPLWSGTYL